MTCPVKVENEELLFRIIRASFNQRRKTLVNAVENTAGIGISKEEIKDILIDLGMSVTIRGEALTLEQFAELSNRISLRCKNMI